MKTFYPFIVVSFILCLTLPSRSQVVGGDTTVQGDFPWMGVLLDNQQFICGSSLIHPQWLLTAGHCALGFPPFINPPNKVILNTIGYANPSGQSETHSIDTIIAHPSYSLINGGRDIALIRLNIPSAIIPVGIALEEDTSYTTNHAADGKVLGWGRTEQTGNPPSDSLKVADVKIIHIDTCLATYDTNNNQATVILNGGEQVICAGYLQGTTPSGAAAGDSGGPLFVDQNGEWIQIGVVSGGGGQITTDTTPGIFTEVASLRAWIDETIAAFEPSVGVDDPRENSWSMLARQEMIILTNGEPYSGSVSLVVYDAVGRVVNQFNSLDKIVQFSTSEWPTGLYIIALTDEHHQPLLIEKLIR